MNLTPLEIEVNSADGELRIAWDNGTETRYPLRYLRGYCPCANCQGHGGPLRFVAMQSPVITNIVEVGNYAINIVWRDDGDATHSTGIYAYDYLQDLDPAAGRFERRDLS